MRPVRDQCSSCAGNPTTTQELSWYTPRSADTKSSEEPILLGVVNRTIHDVCMKEASGSEAMMGLMDRHRPSDGEWDQFSRLDIVGFDDISLKKVTEILSRSAQDVLTLQQSYLVCEQIVTRQRSKCCFLGCLSSCARR